MGFPNQTGISVIYNGTPIPPIPPTPVQTNQKSKFKWVLYNRKIRNRNKF